MRVKGKNQCLIFERKMTPEVTLDSFFLQYKDSDF